MNRLFVDTSAWFAFVNRSDPDHGIVRDILRPFAGRLVTSNFVFDETVTLCLLRLGHDAAVRTGRAILDKNLVDIIRLTPEDEEKAWALFTQRSDKTYSYTDCTSFILMKRLGLNQVAALDADFKREGFEVIP